MRRYERPIWRPAVTTAPLDDELVLYAPGSPEVHVLNATGARVWALCDGGHTTAAIARSLAAAFALPYRQAAADVRALLGDLHARNLIEIR